MTKINYIKMLDVHYVKSVSANYCFNVAKFTYSIFVNEKMFFKNYDYKSRVSKNMQEFVYNCFDEPYPPVLKYEYMRIDDQA